MLALFGGNWGNNGFGGNGGIGENYALATDFATIERKIDGVNNGLCDGFYSTNMNIANGNAAIQQTLSQGFAGLNTGIVTQGYESRLATQDLMAQLASCCCDIKGGIKDNTTQGILNTNAIQQQISSCCCENEKLALQSKFDAAQANCATLTAIDKLGDRIIDYLANDKAQALRDENFALKLAASQERQNTELINTLRPCPIPSYTTCNPWATQTGFCGCGCM